ncbi:MAG: (2Fe-2S)-binding protein [Chloroflexota bacterium]
MAKIVVQFTLNGNPVDLYTEPYRTLLEVVRDDLGLTGSKEGCGTGDCGACTMIVNGKTVNSCLMLIPEVQQTDVVTVEGLATNGHLHPVQQAFIDHSGLQCGFCIPGMLMSAAATVKENPQANEEEIRIGLAGNLCRCTGYDKIVKAVLAVTLGEPAQVATNTPPASRARKEELSPVIMFQE